MNDTTLTNILRWIHVLAGAAWLGEVVVINFVLVPTLVRLGADKRGLFLAAIFPRIFRLASVLSLTVVLTGAALNLHMESTTNRGQISTGPVGFNSLLFTEPTINHLHEVR